MNNIVGAADCVNGLRLSDGIKNPRDIAIALDFDTIDFQQDIARLNPGQLCGSVTYDDLRLDSTRIGFDP